jgi:mono/diheme cytochrome c family protein
VKVPRWLTYVVVMMVVLSWVPLALILRARQVKSPKPRIHIVQDMDNQPKLGPQSRNRLFADRRAMRPPVAGTVARGELRDDDRLHRGAVGDEWIEQFPVPVTEQLLRRGRERYDIYCSPCHGLVGYGDGMAAKRAEALQEGTWTPPASFHTELVRGRPVGHLYNSITNGIRSMPAYGPQIAVEDRWAIVAYLRALQRSQSATVEDVAPELRAQLR